MFTKTMLYYVSLSLALGENKTDLCIVFLHVY